MLTRKAVGILCMNRFAVLSGFLIVVCALLARAQEESVPEVFDCSRIVSFAPSITETLFELGLGSSVAGVTRYDRYPDEAATLPRLGGLLDPNLEAFMLLKPSMAVMLREHGDLAESIQALGVKTLVLNHDSVESILASFETIGRACGKEEQAEALVRRLRLQIAQVKEDSLQRRSWRVLVVIGNNGGRELRNLFVSGRDGFFSELLRIAGAENVYRNSTSGLMNLSSEGLLQLNPQLILNISSGEEELRVDRETFQDIWKEFPQVEAVRERRIFVLDKDYMSVPGPRLDRALVDIQSVLRQAEADDRNASGS